MSLLHPALLYLVAMAAAPILLHLLLRQRVRTLELSTFRFLFDTYVRQRRQLRFVDAILALLRSAAIALLVLVVCRPTFRHWGALFETGAGRDVVMLVDCSASMNAKTAGVSAFERAKAAARSVAGRLGREDRLTLVRLTGRAEEVLSHQHMDSERVAATIADLKLSAARANVFAGLTQVLGRDAGRTGNVLLYVFTDGQANGWREVAEQGMAQLLPAGSHVVVVNVGARDRMPNVAVLGNPPSAGHALAGLPLQLEAKVANFNREQTAEVTLGLFLDDKEAARAQLKIAPGETVSHLLTIVPTEPGVHRGRFEVSGKFADYFPDDNQYRFSLAVGTRLKVLLVDGSDASDPLLSECLHLRSALASPQSVLAASASGTSALPLDIQEIAEANLDAGTLRDASVVILANCGGVTVEQSAALRAFVAQGGGVLLFPGDRVTPDICNERLFDGQAPLHEHLTPVRLGAPAGDLNDPTTFQRLAWLDITHPALSVFAQPEAGYLKTARFYRRFTMSVPAGGAARTLARFGDNQSALVESRLGDGVAILAAFPASPKWTNLPLKPEFVPMLLRLVAHVQRGPELEAPSVVPAENSAAIQVAGAWEPASGKLIAPDGGSENLEFVRSGRRLVAFAEGMCEVGYYGLKVEGSPLERPRRAIDSFAVNVAADESDFTLVREDQLRQWLPNVKLDLVDASAESQQLYGALEGEQEAWRPLIMALFALIGVEFLLATWSGSRADREEAPNHGQRVRRLAPGSWVGRMTGAELEAK
jgi:hypothetical protein